VILKFNLVGNREFADLVLFADSPANQIPECGTRKVVKIKSAEPGFLATAETVWSVTLEMEECVTTDRGGAKTVPATCLLEVLRILKKLSMPT
jgi:hypothetical protein